MSPDAITLIALLCKTQPPACEKRMTTCVEWIDLDLRHCERKISKKLDGRCADTIADWRHTNSNDRAQYCSVFLTNAPFPSENLP